MIPNTYDKLKYYRLLTSCFWIAAEMLLLLVLPLAPFFLFRRCKKIKIASVIEKYAALRFERTKAMYYKFFVHCFQDSTADAVLSIAGWAYDAKKRKRFSLYLVENNRVLRPIPLNKIRLDLLRIFKTYDSLFSGFVFGFTFEEVMKLENLSICVESNGRLVPLKNKTSSKVNASKISDEEVGYIDSSRIDTSALNIEKVQRILNHDFFVSSVFSAFELKDSEYLDRLRGNEFCQILEKKNVYFRDYKVKRLESCDEREIQRIRTASRFSFQEPKFFPEKDKRKKTITCTVPPEEIIVQDDVKLLRANVVITNTNEYLLWDKSADPKFDITASHWQYILNNKKQEDHAFFLSEFNGSERLEKGILINGRCSTNYYHWLIEYLPRILEIKKDELYVDYPILIEKNLPDSIQKSLELICGNDRLIVQIDPKTVYSIGKLVIPSMLTFQPDSIEFNFEQISGFNIPKLQEVRDLFLSLKSNREFPKRVYIGRKNQARSLKNTDEIIDIVTRAGFEIVDPVNLTLLEQVQLFNNAEEIVLPAGAANSNAIFCKPSCKIFCFVAERNKFHYAHKIMADVAGADFTYVTGYDYKSPNLFRNPYQYMHSDFYMKPAEVEKILRGIS